MTISITYDNTSSLGTADILGTNVTTILTSYVRDESIESTIALVILRNVDMNGTELKCSSENLDEDTSIVYVNTNGIVNPKNIVE